ncbi:TRAP transporter substrate-binding protein [Martelella soudanensis]|uniref:TRAP transporter substrate-binding protein n=1 Tax=unclassified Martelella TaxID=2629616 RepID=UPI0015DF6E54|nr:MULTISPECIES: TRAP transporter substrate-binding protein [unclassified Martelella]
MTMFKSITAAAALVALTTLGAKAEEMKFANYMPAMHPYVAGAFQPFAEMVEKGTNGDVTVRLYNGGELGPGPVEQYTRVSEGVAEFAISLPGYTASNFPRTLLAELPGVINVDTGTRDIWKNIELFEPEYRRVKLIGLWSSAPNLLYMRDKAVHSPEDLKGLKIRVPSRNSGLMVEAWGASPVSIPVSDIYNAMQTGVIDGAMIDGTATKAFKLGEVANYLTVGMESTVSPFFILMNRDAFESLSPEDQAAVEKAGMEASLLGQKVQLDVAADGIQAFADMQGKEVIELTPEEAEAFNTLSAPIVGEVIAEEAANGIEAQQIVDALRADQ